MVQQQMSTHEKALNINLDPSRYGSFAEIGAGQEVGRWFFRVGGAAGTIAKTMSAYDKKVSDAIYGTAERYVSSGRLQAMLDYEYDLNIERLDADRGAETAFFAFADTVTAQNYHGTANCNGWMGIRFQSLPRAQASQIVLHTRMLDRDGLLQQEALGIVGVNLVYGAMRLWDRPEALLASLLDNLGKHRIEIDMVEFSGAAFQNVDHRVICLRLVELGFTNAAMFSTNGHPLRPTEILYKKPVLVQRGRFRPPTRVHADIQERSLERFSDDPLVDRDRIVSLLDIGLEELRETSDASLEDFHDRIVALTAGDFMVLISDNAEHRHIAEYLARYSTDQIALPLDALSLQLALQGPLDEEAGDLLQRLGGLFSRGVRVYVYPAIDPDSGQRIELDSMELSPSVAPLIDYLRRHGLIQPLDGLPDEALKVRSDDVLAMIQSGSSRWEEYVLPEVATEIKEHALFGYKG